MTKSLEISIPIENKKEGEEVLSFLSELNAEEKKEFLAFVRGIGFAKKFQPEKIA